MTAPAARSPAAGSPALPGVLGRIRPRPRWLELRLLALVAIALAIGSLSLGATLGGTFRLYDAQGLGIYIVALFIAHAAQVMAGRRTDQILLPTVAMLGGISLLLMQRLPQDLVVQSFGGAKLGLAQVQLIWLLGALAIATTLGIVVRSDSWLRRYKYTWAAAGVGLLLLTFVFGTEINGQRLTLVLGPLRLPPVPYLAPMVAMWAIALGIVVVQRDLGAALLFFGVFLAMLYIATGRISLVIIGLVLFLLGSAVMANLFDHIRTRVDIWLDPFADPLGAGFQVVQALHAFARGGLVGVGLGAGLPEIAGRPPIPEVHTDFPLAALGEELGVLGVVAILGLFLVVVERGLRIGAAAADDFRSLLAVGLALVIGIQAFIIAAGTLKVLPLTGVTLPYISYGGSSLLANAVIVGLLLALSDKGVEPPPPPRAGARRRWPRRGADR